MKQPIHILSGAARPSSATPTVANARTRTRANRRRILNIGITCFVLAAGLVFVGCGKGSKVSTVTGEDVKPVDPNASTDAQQDQRLKMALAMREGIMPPEPALKLRGGEQATPEVLEAYNQLLLRAMVQRREPPETLQEMLRWGLPKLPTPPAGKRIVFDGANCIIRLDPP